MSLGTDSNNVINRIIVSGMVRGEGHAKPAPTPLPAPELMSPVNNQHFPPYPRRLTLTWKAVSGATGYIVTVQFYSNTSQGKTWLTKPPINTAATSLTVDFPANIPGRWYVSAVDSTGAHTPSPNSQYGTFDFTVQTLSTPTLIFPTNGQTFSSYPRKTTLAWTPVPGATAYVVTVEACQDRQIAPASIWQGVLKATTQATTLTFDFVGAQPGRWNVFAIDSTNNRQQSSLSPWSNFFYTI